MHRQYAGTHRQYAGGPSRRRAGTGIRLTAAAVAVAALGGLALRADRPSSVRAQNAAQPLPSGVPSGVGASIDGLTEYAATGPGATTNGTVIGPDYTQGDLATEATGREAVQLTAQGQFVQFTLTAPANAFDLSYALNQGASGSLSVYVNGSKLSQELSLTSAHSYISTPNIMGSKTHHFFDDARMLLPSILPAGSTVKLQVGPGNTAVPYTISVADFYDVPPAASRPANSVSVVAEGADPTGRADSTAAFGKAISAATAKGGPVWIPPGTFLISSPLQVKSATIVGAGDWYAQIKTNAFIDNTTAVPGPVNLSGFAILGSTVGRHDDSTANAINGSLGTGSVVNGLWIQDTNVGFWLQFGNKNITVENCEILSTDADGLNFNGNATDSTVKNNFIRNTGDDGLAIWSYPAADSGITLSNNTVVQPNLANGIADYGGSDNTITRNVIADTNALGSGLAISNEQFLSPGFAPLSGTITVSDNVLLRTGAMNPNWHHPMGAIRIDSYDYPINDVTINVTGNTVDDSPFSAFEIVAGGGHGLPVTGLNVSNNTVNWTGTVVFQAETSGSATVSGLTASHVGVPGAYNVDFPGNKTGAFVFNLGGNDSGFSAGSALTAFPMPVAIPPAGSAVPIAPPAPVPPAPASPSARPAPPSPSARPSPASRSGRASLAPAPPPPPPASSPAPAQTRRPSGWQNLALGKGVWASGFTQVYVPANAVDGNTMTYWESTDHAFPQWFTVDLGSAVSIGRIVMDLPPLPVWWARTQTLSISGSTNGMAYTTIVGSRGYTFNPATGNTASVSFPPVTARFVKLTFTANTGWPAGQLSELMIYGNA
jgi:hypothetical protein